MLHASLPSATDGLHAAAAQLPFGCDEVRLAPGFRAWSHAYNGMMDDTIQCQERGSINVLRLILAQLSLSFPLKLFSPGLALSLPSLLSTHSLIILPLTHSFIHQFTQHTSHTRVPSTSFVPSHY